jgi:hypothetical protein
VRQPTPGDLFACRWEAHEPDEQDSFRVIEVVAVRPEDIDVFVYGDSFASTPTEADVTKLRPSRLHKTLGGAVRVPHREFATWEPSPVRRVDEPG